MTHTPVLLQEVVTGLLLEKGDRVLDGTINGAGHSEAIVAHIGDKGVLIGIDLDSDALKEAQARLKGATPKVILHEGNFRNFDVALKMAQIEKIDKVLLDLGLSLRQIEDSGRGFSFSREEPLAMTFRSDSEGEITASDIVNEWNEETIADILYGYAEERLSHKIARAIVETRHKSRITTTTELSDLISKTVGKHGKTHPATKTFQALRIAVNSELENLKVALDKFPQFLEKDSRIAIISFHSLEDRIVKQRFRFWENGGIGTRVNKKAIMPSEIEKKDNPRARSARLRIFQIGQ